MQNHQDEKSYEISRWQADVVNSKILTKTIKNAGLSHDATFSKQLFGNKFFLCRRKDRHKHQEKLTVDRDHTK